MENNIGAAYDVVATLYAELFSDMLATRPIERGLLAAFAELVRDAGPVADVGCGPGHLTARCSLDVAVVSASRVGPAPGRRSSGAESSPSAR